MFAMHMAVCDLLDRGGTHTAHLEDKTQGLPSQGVVAIQQHLLPLDLEPPKGLRLPVAAPALQLPALHAWWKLAFGNAARQRRVAFTEGISGRQCQRRAKADRLPLQGRLKLGENGVVAAVQISELARIQGLPPNIRHLIGQCYRRVFGNVQCMPSEK